MTTLDRRSFLPATHRSSLFWWPHLAVRLNACCVVFVHPPPLTGPLHLEPIPLHPCLCSSSPLQHFSSLINEVCVYTLGRMFGMRWGYTGMRGTTKI